MLSTKVKEDATKNHKFHIPFSWIKFHHIDKSENEDATKNRKFHIPFSWIKFHHIDIFHLIMKSLLYTKIWQK